MSALKKVVLALGSNVGNRRENLKRALAEIEKFAEVFGVSQIYETRPVGFDEQRDFLNAAIAAETDVCAMELLGLCKAAESRLGRTPSVKNGPREIDIDIIFYEDLRMSEPELQIPHPRWNERDFVTTPLLDLLAAGALESAVFAEARKILGERFRAFPPFSNF